MKKQTGNIRFLRGCAMALAIYVMLAGVFYYAAGQQLYQRQSKKEITYTIGGRTTPEITGGQTVRQTFLCEMDILTRFSVSMATFARENKGVLQVALWDLTAERQVYGKKLRMETLADNQGMECVLENEAAGVRGHTFAIELSAPGAKPGNAVASWLADIGDVAGQQLSVNGAVLDGTLCFAAQGLDYVWTGPHYWQLVCVAGSLLCLCLLVLFWKKTQGKPSIVFAVVQLGQRYRFLVKQLVSRDFKIKYRRSVLGALWSFVNPLMTMCVQYVVFSTIFKSGIANYPVYLLSGVVFFNFFTEATNVTLHAITGNAGLITKVYVPKLVYPLSKVLSTGVNLLISLLPLLLMSLATGIRVTKAWLILPYVILCLVVFCMGMGFVLSAVMVFFRDMQFIWSVLCTVLTYVTPVFYPESILSGPMQAALAWNPMHQYILFFRTIILEGISPEPWLYAKCMLFSLAFFFGGYAVFRRVQDQFIFHI